LDRGGARTIGLLARPLLPLKHRRDRAVSSAGPLEFVPSALYKWKGGSTRFRNPISTLKKETTMNLVRRTGSPLSIYRPTAIEDQFGRMVENMFEDFFAPIAQGSALSRWPQEGTISPRLNVTETDKSFLVEAEMPGVKKEDIKVAVENQRVTIEGEAKREEEQREGENVVYSERSARRFMRSFQLPTDVDDSIAEARLENGILSLTLPKKAGAAAKKITIQ
jgi:HSP20 family protein